MRRTRSMTLPAMAVGALALTACSDGGAATSTPSPDAGTASPTEASPEPTQTESTTATGGATAECLEGEWEGDLRTAETSTLGTLQLGELEVEPEIESSGQSVLTFDGSEMTTEYQDQTTTVSLSPPDGGGELVVTTTLNGTTTGSYAVEDDALTVTEVDVSDLTTENTATLGGSEYELPGLEETQADTFAMDTRFTVDCSEDELRLTPVADDVPMPDDTAAPAEDEVEDALEMVFTRR